MNAAAKHELVLILDFGGQYTQLIARRVRELHVFSEIIPFDTPLETLTRRNPKAIILSGGPASVYAASAPVCDTSVLKAGIPVLGICTEPSDGYAAWRVRGTRSGGRVRQDDRPARWDCFSVRRPSDRDFLLDESH